MNYITIDEVVAIHYEVVNRFGGKKGVSNFGLLHSAVERPKATFGGKDLYKTIFNKAASLLHSLVLNHAFHDGNKRTAYVATARFLAINKHTQHIPKNEAVSYLLKIEKEKLSINVISKWIRVHIKKT